MHAYVLEPYKGANSRYNCPACGKARQFTRYMHHQTNEYLHETVGVCNRINNCGYHYSPKQYFANYPAVQHEHNVNKSVNIKLTGDQERGYMQGHPPSFISRDLFDRSLTGYDTNNFALGLEKLFGTGLTIDLLRRFYIGTTKKPANGTIFWQLDDQYRVRTGKIMGYNPDTLKRLKNGQQNVNTPLTPVDWVHSRMLREKKLQGFSLQQCLFGLHQLQQQDKTLPISIVESEKTAVIATVYMPNYIWMATGGAQNVNGALMQPLKGRKVILFPDVNQYQQWSTKANNISQQLATRIIVSDFIETKSTAEMREKGADIADVLIKRDSRTGLALTDSDYPVMWNS